MSFDVEVGPSGVTVEVEGVVGRRTGKPARLVFDVTMNGTPVAEHLWFEGMDALAFYLASARAGDLVRMTGRVYHYGYGKSNIEDVSVVVVGRASRDQVVRMSDATPEFPEMEGQFSMADPAGDLVWFPDSVSRNAAIDATYF